MRKLAWQWIPAILAMLALGAPIDVPRRPPAVALRAASPSRSFAPNAVRAAIARLPLRFEANAGQWDGRARYVARVAAGATLLLTDDGMTFALSARDAPHRRPGPGGVRPEKPGGRPADAFAAATVTMRLAGSRPAVPRGEDPLITRSHYFFGSDPARWRTDVANFGRVRSEGGLPGVAMVWHAGDEGLEYDLEIAAGSDASRLELEIDGAGPMAVRDDGTLRIETTAGVLEQRPPLVTQAGHALRARYRLDGPRRVGLGLEGYDRAEPVLIDPVLVYSTYLGGSSTDYARAIAVDASGSAYVTGEADSSDFPVTNVLPGAASAPSSSCAFVSKLDPSGSALAYSTYLCGTAFARGYAIAVDPGGDAYVGGESYPGFPTTTNAVQPTYPGKGTAAFVTRLNASGSAIVYSTYFGGNGGENTVSGIAVDATGSAYIAGSTFGGSNFPIVNPLQSVDAGQTSGGESGHAFVAKLNPAGSALVYSTYLGGSGGDSASGIAVDTAGSAFVSGVTESRDFPTVNAAQGTLGGAEDAFVAKLSASGSALIYSSYVGGSDNDAAAGIAIDASGSAYLAGWTISDDFPVTTALRLPGDAGEPSHAFVTKLTPSGSALAYSTCFGGSSIDEATGVAVDSSGRAYVTGYTFSTDFPLVNPVQATLPATNGSNPFVSVLSPSGSALAFSTYLGGSIDDLAYGIGVDGIGTAYVTGEVTSVDFPTVNALQPKIGNPAQCCLPDAFVTKLSIFDSPVAASSADGSAGAPPEDAAVAGDSSIVDAWVAEDSAAPIPGMPAVRAAAPADGSQLVVAGCGCDVVGDERTAPGAYAALGVLAALSRRRRARTIARGRS